MEIIDQHKIDDLMERGFTLRGSDYISGGIQMVKDHLGPFVGFTLLSLIINAAAGVVPFGGLLVGAPLSAGFFIVANRINQGIEPEIGDFFKGFEYFGQLVVYTLLTALLIVALLIPLGLVAITMTAFSFDSDPGVFFIFMFGMVAFFVAIYIGISLIWAPHLIVFANKRAWESMETSFKVIKQDFWNFAGFAMLLVLLNLGGLLCLGVGLLFTIPASACAIYLAFEDVMELDQEGRGDDIERHLVP